MYNLRSKSRNAQKPKNSNPPKAQPVKAKKAKTRDRVRDKPKQITEDHDVDLDETVPIEEFLENYKRKAEQDEQENTENVTKKAKIEETPVVTSGLVMTFGDDFCGELGLKKTGFSKKRPVLVEGIKQKVTQIVCGGMHNVCITTNGEIYTWGCNDEGALGRKTDNPPKGRNLEAEPNKVPFSSKAKKVTAGDSHSAALTSTGEIYIWGNFKDSAGNIGIKPDSDSLDGQFQPLRIELPNTNFVDLASGIDHILLLTDTGVVYSIGSGEQGQLGRLEKNEWKEVKNTRDIYLKPAIVKFDDESIRCDQIWAGQYSSFARSKNGDIYAWGLNNYSQLGIPQTNTHQDDLIVPFPIQISSLSKLNGQVEQICQGQHFMLVRDATGKVYSCGRHEYGRLGHGKIDNSLEEPKRIEKLDAENIICISTGSINSFAVNEKGHLYSWGMSGTSLGLGDDDVWEPTLVESKNLSTHHVISVSAGSQHTVIIVTPKSD